MEPLPIENQYHNISEKKSGEKVAFQTHLETENHKNDNANFLLSCINLKTEVRQEFQRNILKYEKNGDVDLLRTAGISLAEYKKDPLKSHVLLSNAFLERQTDSSQLSFQVNFKNNELAEWYLGLGHILPPNILSVDIYDHHHELLFANAHRGIKNGKAGYYTADGQYAFVHTGFSVVMKETQPSLGLVRQEAGSEAYKNSFIDEMQFLKIKQKTVLKDSIRVEAKKVGKSFLTDEQFFDTELDQILQNLGQEVWRGFQENGSFDLEKVRKESKDLIQRIGYIDNIQNVNFTQQFQKARPAEALKIWNTKPPKPPEDLASSALALTNIPIQKVEYLNDSRRAIVETARSYVGSTEFRGSEVAGGKLGCALVATTVLKSAGIVDKVSYNVDGAVQLLVAKGWTKHTSPTNAGDVIVWGRTPSHLRDGLVVPGHQHIGIVTYLSGNQAYSVNNNSSRAMPVESKIDFNSPRGIYFLSPPA